MPNISVVLPVYNGAPWLEGAINCVLDQSYTDFELVVIDDGSKDNSWDLINRFTDPRIKAHRQVNRGLAATLNIGLELAVAPLVARQDQDDWMHPERLARQVVYMEAHPDCAAVGTWAEIREDDVFTGRLHKHALGNTALRLNLMFDNPFVHSSMMLRKAAVLQVGGYCEDKILQPPEDYALWSNLASHFEVGNIGELLTAYREVAGSMSRSGVSPFQRNVLRISIENMSRTLGSAYTDDQYKSLSMLYHGVDSGLSLSRQKALDMLKALAVAIAGEPTNWTEEFANEHARLAAFVSSRCLQRHLPSGLLNTARKLKRILA
jgi:glycosyltransferase involved in cell wall biosynthesis